MQAPGPIDARGARSLCNGTFARRTSAIGWRFALAFCLLAPGVLIPAGEAPAQVTFSTDFQGPTPGLADGFAFGPITAGDILTVPVPGVPGPNAPVPGPFAAPPGIEIGAAAGAAGVLPGGLGILPGAGGVYELDALSYGRDTGAVQFLFSVDEFAVGVPGAAPDVASEGALGLTGASADVFMLLAAFGTFPPGGVIGNAAVFDGNGIGPSALPGVALIEPGAPTVGVIPELGDNLDAMDLNTTLADLSGPIYFSLDGPFPDPNEPLTIANAGTGPANGFSGADVLVSTAGGVPALAIPAVLMGLDLAGAGTDDLDALIFDDADASMGYTPGDTLYFSVRRGSAVVGAMDSFYGVPIEEGDVLTLPTGPGLPPAIFLPAEALGLGTARTFTAGPWGPDDLNAMDLLIDPPVPPVPSASGLGYLLIVVALVASAALLRSPRVSLG